MPLEIGISNSFVIMNLFESQKIRDAYMHYFSTMWRLASA